MALYTQSSGPIPNLSANMRPGTEILDWVIRTALGSPLVPDVKTRATRSSGPAGAPERSGCAVSACRASRSAHCGESTEITGMSIDRPSSRPAWSVSVRISAQSASAASRARAAPRRVGLSPATTISEHAAAPSRWRYSGVPARSSPTWGGDAEAVDADAEDDDAEDDDDEPSTSRSAAIRTATSPTACDQGVNSPSEKMPRSRTSRSATTASATEAYGPAATSAIVRTGAFTRSTPRGPRSRPVPHRGR